jgi:hypothetical protein
MARMMVGRYLQTRNLMSIICFILSYVESAGNDLLTAEDVGTTTHGGLDNIHRLSRRTTTALDIFSFTRRDRPLWLREKDDDAPTHRKKSLTRPERKSDRHGGKG